MVSETAVVGIPDDIKGEVAYSFVILKENVTESEDEIRVLLNAHISKNIAKFAVPQDIVIVQGLPKTRSGKIMRRILRKIAAAKDKTFSDIEKDLGDLSTLDKPEVVKQIMDKRSFRN